MSWILVTGSAKGLGKEIALELASKKYNVLVHYNTSEHEAELLVQELRHFDVKSEKIQGNFSSKNKLIKFIKKLENFQIKHLVNNVGNYFIGSALNTSFDVEHELFMNNVHVPLCLIRHTIESIKEKQGAIINIGVAGLNSDYADMYSAAYSGAKSALLSMTRSLARELAPDNVRVNMVSPGYLSHSIDKPDPASLPMKRFGDSKEVARMISFLLKDRNSYITGQNIEVAGGVRL